MHKVWIKGHREFDLFLVYYGDGDGYRSDADIYEKAKGTKFNIVAGLDIPEGYEFIFVPDDDLHIEAHDINRLFAYMAEYKLSIAQPSLVGYYSVPINLHRPASILRYTNFVEIIAPCFSRSAYDACRHLFDNNKSCWGQEKLWDKELGFPKDKIAIIDDVIVVHTRPCFMGDNYKNNNVVEPWKDIQKIVDDHGLSWDMVEYGQVGKDVFEQPHVERCHPPLSCTEDMCRRIYKSATTKLML